MTPNDLVMHSASAQSISGTDKSFCSLEIRNVVTSIYSYVTSLETAIYSSHSDERLDDEHCGNKWEPRNCVQNHNVAIVNGKTYLHKDVLLRESKRQRKWQYPLRWDSLDLNNKRQNHHSQGFLQSELKNALKAEGGFSTILLPLSHGGCFL